MRIWALAQDGTLADRLASSVSWSFKCIRTCMHRRRNHLDYGWCTFSGPLREFCTHSYTFCRCSVLCAEPSSNAQVGVIHP